MDRMIKDLKDGETYIYANSSDEYEAFTNWLYKNGWEFAYHFESGEAFQRERPNGWKTIIEVNGL
jgi:hypothetical protein